MDRFTDAVWQTLEGRLAELSAQVGQAARRAQPPAPSQRKIRGYFFDKSEYRW